MNERIRQRRDYLAEQEVLANVTRREKAAEELAAMEARQAELIRISELAGQFNLWARSSRIRPQRIPIPFSYKTKKGWELMRIPEGTYDSEKGRQPLKTLRLFVDGTADWQGDGLSRSPATAESVERGIVDFIASSQSQIPWPE